MTDCAGDHTPLQTEPKLLENYNVWKFVQSDTDMKVFCNGELVTQLVFRDVSERCYNKWGGGGDNTVYKVSFNRDHDEASKQYRIPCEYYY